MAGTVDVGTGMGVAFGTTSYSCEYLSGNIEGGSRPVVDTSHMGTTGTRTKRVGDLKEPVRVRLSCHFDPDEQPPISSPEETVTLTFAVASGNTNGATCAGPAAVTEWSAAIPLEDKMMQEMTVQFMDDETWTDGS